MSDNAERVASYYITDGGHQGTRLQATPMPMGPVFAFNEQSNDEADCVDAD